MPNTKYFYLFLALAVLAIFSGVGYYFSRESYLPDSSNLYVNQKTLINNIPTPTQTTTTHNKTSATPTITPSSVVKRVGLSAKNGLTVCSLENHDLRQAPSDASDRVGAKTNSQGETFGSVFQVRWCGSIIDSSPDATWLKVDLQGSQNGWSKAKYLKLEGYGYFKVGQLNLPGDEDKFWATERVGLVAERYVIVEALEDYRAKKSPSDVADDANMTFAKGQTSQIFDATSDGNWYVVKLANDQTGWVKAEYLKVVDKDPGHYQYYP